MVVDPLVVAPDLDEAERRELRRKARAAILEALRALGGEATRRNICERARADGGFTPRELHAAAPERGQDKYQSLVDHQLSWALTNLRRDGMLENPKWGTWKLAGAALENPAPAIEEHPTDERLAELRAMSYQDYLRTPEWRRTRAGAILRAGNSCSLDVTHTDELEVHHRTYERLGEELASDLVVLCRSCHHLHHVEYGRPRRDRPRQSRPARRSTTQDLATKLAAEARAERKPSLLKRLFGS